MDRTTFHKATDDSIRRHKSGFVGLHSRGRLGRSSCSSGGDVHGDLVFIRDLSAKQFAEFVRLKLFDVARVAAIGSFQSVVSTHVCKRRRDHRVRLSTDYKNA